MKISETIIKDIGLYKNRFLSLLLESSDLCDVLLSKDNCTSEEVDNLAYSQIFPYLYIDDTQTKVFPYVCFEINIPRIPTGTIKDIQIVVWAYCHKDCMKYSKNGYLGNRADILADIVEGAIHNCKNLGIGVPTLQSVKPIFPQSKYYGRELIFSIPDFKIRRSK